MIFKNSEIAGIRLRVRFWVQGFLYNTFGVFV